MSAAGAAANLAARGAGEGDERQIWATGAGRWRRMVWRGLEPRPGIFAFLLARARVPAGGGSSRRGLSLSQSLNLNLLAAAVKNPSACS